MKILHVVHQFLPYHHHGAEVSTYELASMQQKLGHKVSVVAGENSPHREPIFHEQEQYRELKVHRIFFSPQTHNGWLKHDGFGKLWSRILESEQPDIVHVQHLKNLSLSLVDITYEMNIPLVFTLRDYSLLCARFHLAQGNGTLCRTPDLESDCLQCMNQTRPMESGEILPTAFSLLWNNIGNPRSWKILSRLASIRIRSERTYPPIRLSSLEDFVRRNDLVFARLQKCSRITAISKDTARRFESLASNRVSVTAVEQIPDTRSCVWEQRKAGNKPLRFGYIGKMSYVKGPHLLLQAFRNLPEKQAELHLFGGPTRTNIRQLAYWRRVKRLADWPGVHLHSEPFESTNINSVMRQIDVLISPSVCFETYGRVVAEALASGIPVICSDEGGPAGIIEPDVNGLTYPIADASALAQTMQRFLDEPDLLESMSALCRVPKMPDQYIDEVIALYEDVLQRKG